MKWKQFCKTFPIAVVLICLTFAISFYSITSKPGYFIAIDKTKHNHQHGLSSLNPLPPKFEGNCKNVFKYQPNNKRDGIFMTIKSDKARYFNDKQMLESFDVTRKAVPNARIIMFVVDGLPQRTQPFVNSIKRNNIELYNIKQPVNGHVISVRFHLIRNFLIEHRNEFDRIICLDATDTGLFGDYFATFNSTQIGWLVEQYGKKKDEFWGPATYKMHYNWFEYYFSKQFADLCVKERYPCINAGFGYGGIEKMIEYLTILVDNMSESKIKGWGYEQSLMNYLYYGTNKVKHLNMKLEKCSDTICYFGDKAFLFTGNQIFYSDTFCPPVAYHKLKSIGRHFSI